MRIFDQWIDEGSGLFLNREIVMFTFLDKKIYCSCFVRNVSHRDIPSFIELSNRWGRVKVL